MKKTDKSKWYEKEFEDISKRISKKDSLSYCDFLRIRNFKIQTSTIEGEERIKKITHKAFKLAENDKVKEAITELIKLDGVAIPIASTILAIKYPNKYAIIDRNVLKALKKYDWIKSDKYIKDSKIYEDYMLLIKKKKPSNISLRDYEFGLYKQWTS